MHIFDRDGVLEAMAWGSRHLKETTSCHHVLGLEHCVLGLGGQVHDLRGKALVLDPFSLLCLVFYVDWIGFMNVGRYCYVDKTATVLPHPWPLGPVFDLGLGSHVLGLRS